MADRLAWSTAKVSRIENARTGAKIADVRRLLELYEIDGSRHDDLVSLAHDAAQRGWWEEYRDLPSSLADFIALESEATAAREWGSTVFPGLLQTENYARHVIGGWSDLATLPPQGWNAGWTCGCGAARCWTARTRWNCRRCSTRRFCSA